MADTLRYFIEVSAKDAGLGDVVSKFDHAAPAIMKTDAALKMHAASLKDMGASAGVAKGAVASFLGTLGGLLTFEGIKELSHQFIDLGREALNAAGKAERLDLSFDLTLGKEGAEDVLGWIEKIAGKTEFTDDALKGWALQLANAGLKGEALKDNMAAILDVAAKRGPQGAEVAVDALSRATLSGKIEGRALRGLGIPVADLAQLDQFKGLNEKQINKKLEDTSVTKEDLLRLIAGPDKQLGDAGIKAAGTFESKLTHLRDLPDQFFQKLAKTEAFGKMTKAIEGILSKLDPDSPTGKKISTFLTDVFTTAANLLEKIDLAAKIDLFTNAMRGFADVAGPVLKFAAHELEGIAFLVGRITGHTKSTEDQKKDIAGESELRILQGKFETDRKFNFENPKNAVNAADLARIKENNAAIAAEQQEGLERVKGVFSDPQAFETAIIGMKQAGKDMSVGLAVGLADGIPDVSQAARNVVKGGAIDPARDEAGAHSPATKFIDLGMDIGDGFIEGMDRKQGQIEEMMRGAFGAPSTGAGGTGGLGMQISISGVEINVHGGEGGRAQGEAAAAAFVGTLRERFIGLMEQAGVE